MDESLRKTLVYILAVVIVLCIVGIIYLLVVDHNSEIVEEAQNAVDIAKLAARTGSSAEEIQMYIDNAIKQVKGVDKKSVYSTVAKDMKIAKDQMDRAIAEMYNYRYRGMAASRGITQKVIRAMQNYLDKL